MPLVHRTHVGAVAYARMVRDGVVSPLLPGVGLPADIPRSPGLRARAIAPHVPPHTVLSGLAGLWVRLDGAMPSMIDVVGARGLHRTAERVPEAGVVVRFHSGRASAEPAQMLEGTRLASCARCAADALRWAVPEEATVAVAGAARSGELDVHVLAAIVRAEAPRGGGHAQMVAGLQTVLERLRRSGGASSP